MARYDPKAATEVGLMFLEARKEAWAPVEHHECEGEDRAFQRVHRKGKGPWKMGSVLNNEVPVDFCPWCGEKLPTDPLQDLGAVAEVKR